MIKLHTKKIVLLLGLAAIIATNAFSMDKINAQLGQGKLVQKKQVVGKISLHQAAKQGFVHIIKFLLDKGADINKGNKNGNTPLHYAIGYNQLETVKFLAKHDAIDFYKENKKKRPPCFVALSNRKFKILQFLATKIDVTKPNSRGSLLIHYAAGKGLIKALKLLLKQPNMHVNTPDKAGRTPLHYAIRNNQLETVKFLVEQPNIDFYKENERGYTPAIYALSHSTFEILKVLVTKIDLTKPDSRGDLLIHYAAGSGLIKALKLLLKQHNMHVNVPDETGRTPLHFAIGKNQLETVKLLVKQLNIDLNRKHYFGDSPIHLAILDYNLPICRLLCDQSTLNINILDNNGDTLLHMLIKQPARANTKSILLTIAKLLVQHDIDLLATNQSGLTAFDCLNEKEQELLRIIPPQHTNGTAPQPQVPAQQNQAELNIVQNLKTILINSDQYRTTPESA